MNKTLIETADAFPWISRKFLRELIGVDRVVWLALENGTVHTSRDQEKAFLKWIRSIKFPKITKKSNPETVMRGWINQNKVTENGGWIKASRLADVIGENPGTFTHFLNGNRTIDVTDLITEIENFGGKKIVRPPRQN